MPGKNKTPLLGWHPASAELGGWVRAEAKRRGMRIAHLLDEMVGAMAGTDRELAARARAEAARRGITLSSLLTTALTAYLDGCTGSSSSKKGSRDRGDIPHRCPVKGWCSECQEMKGSKK